MWFWFWVRVVHLYLLFLAFFRLDMRVVCDMSRTTRWDFHDYPDTESGQPFHFVTDRCVRCGKEFSI